jgi:hypothetical protein
MKLRGQDVEDGLREWVKGELKEGASRGYDLGKFFFSVSAATIGVLATIETLSSSAKVDILLITSIIILFLSSILAIEMVLPSIQSVGGESDLLDDYHRRVVSTIRRVWLWVILWLIGTIMGGYAVL